MKNIGILLHVTTLLFVALKLTGHIDWSWWWVLLPSYGPLTLGLLCHLLPWLIIRFWMTEGERNLYYAEKALEELAEHIGRRQ